MQFLSKNIISITYRYLKINVLRAADHHILKKYRAMPHYRPLPHCGDQIAHAKKIWLWHDLISHWRNIGSFIHKSFNTNWYDSIK